VNKIESTLEKGLFASRWLLAPFYVGLVMAVLLLMAKFAMKFASVVGHFSEITSSALVVDILGLIDLALIANLLIIITFSGYESFVSKMDVDDHEDKPSWMGKVGFAELKMKVIGSIVAISAIELLRVFITMDNYDIEHVKWKIIMHATFVLSGFMFAVSDWLGRAGR
jgi:uncharacterized protein (TIGR00645 family)